MKGGSVRTGGGEKAQRVGKSRDDMKGGVVSVWGADEGNESGCEGGGKMKGLGMRTTERESREARRRRKYAGCGGEGRGGESAAEHG
jgi:hypothetical protein